MTRTKQAPPQAQPTTAQQLGSLVKSARDIMRKDKGLSGDLDRLPMLTWIMFLKFLDDLEQIEESRAKLGKTRYRSAIEPPYRWRDWAAKEDAITAPSCSPSSSTRNAPARTAPRAPACSPTSAISVTATAAAPPSAAAASSRPSSPACRTA